MRTLWKIVKGLLIVIGIISTVGNVAYIFTYGLSGYSKALDAEIAEFKRQREEGDEPIVRPIMFMNNK